MFFHSYLSSNIAKRLTIFELLKAIFSSRLMVLLHVCERRVMVVGVATWLFGSKSLGKPGCLVLSKIQR